MATWYVDTNRTAINWGAAVSGGVATVDIHRIVTDESGQRTLLYARAGSPVTSAQVTLAQSEQSGDAIPAAVSLAAPRAGLGSASLKDGSVVLADLAPSLTSHLGTTYVSRAEVIEQCIIPPASISCATTGESAWYTANRMNLMRFHLDRPVRVSRVTLSCGTASGNIEVAVYSVTRTGVNAYGVTKVATSGPIPCPTPGTAPTGASSISVPFTSDVLLQPGQYALGLWCDNTTATFAHNLINAGVRAGWCLGDGAASTGGAPTTIPAATTGGRAFAATIESAIPVRPGAVLLGDSITANQTWFSTANGQRGTLYNLSYNAGVGGQQTPAILGRVAADVVARTPSAVTVLAGTNDIGASTSPDSAPIITNIGAMLTQILAGTTATIFLGTVPPRNYDAGQTALSNSAKAALNAVNAWIRAQGSNRVRVVDWTVQLSTGDGVTPNLTYFSDHVHPNAAGQDVMAGVLAPLL